MCVCVKSWSLTGESEERKKWGELGVGRWGFRVPRRRDSLRPIRQQAPLWDGVFSAGLDCPVGCATEAPASRVSPPSPRSVSPLVLLSLLLLRGHCQQRNSQTHRCRLLVSPGGNLCCPPTCLPRDGHRCLKETTTKKMGLCHPSVICVDNVFLLFVCFPPSVILMQWLSSLMTGMWGNAMPGQCIISATEVVFSAFLLFSPPPTPLP